MAAAARRLEDELDSHRDLPLPVALFCGDGPQSGADGTRIRIAELDMIERVIGLQPELRRGSLLHAEVLERRSVRYPAWESNA